MKPTIGRVVIYTPTEHENNHLTHHGCTASDKLAATVVGVSEKGANLKVHPDGDLPAIYKTEVSEGAEPGQWSWPVTEEKTEKPEKPGKETKK